MQLLPKHCISHLARWPCGSIHQRVSFVPIVSSHHIHSWIVPCCTASSIVGGSRAPDCPYPTQPDWRKKISHARTQVRMNTAKVTKPHVQSNHNPNPNTPALPPAHRLRSGLLRPRGYERSYISKSFIISKIKIETRPTMLILLYNSICISPFILKHEFCVSYVT